MPRRKKWTITKRKFSWQNKSRRDRGDRIGRKGQQNYYRRFQVLNTLRNGMEDV